MTSLRSVFPQLPLGLLHRHWKLLLLVLLGILMPLAVVGEIAEDLLENERFLYETPLLLSIHAHATPVLDVLMVAVTHLGGFKALAVYSATLMVWLWLRRYRRQTLFLALAMGGAALITFSMKLFFGRERPELWPRLVAEPDPSFPSGHALGSMAFAVTAAVLAWRTRWRWPLVIGLGVFSLLVGFTRLYLGVHYPTDVIAGWLAGLAWVLSVKAVMFRGPRASAAR